MAQLAALEHAADPGATRLWLRMLSCTNIIQSRIRTRLREEFGNTLPRFDVLAQLDRAPEGLTLGEVSRRLMVSPGNITALVERLVTEGLVDRRVNDRDRRSSIVRLTARGRREFARQAAAHAAWLEEMLAPLGTADAERLGVLLGRAKRCVQEGR
jgi:DNA-binding MarR family transcriptional regulator